MAEESIIDIRLGNIERDCREIKEEFREFEDRVDNHSERLNDLEHWYQGNASRGAEERLQCVEGYAAELNKANLRPRMNMVEAEIVALQKIADSAIMEGVQGAVNDTLDRRSKTAVERMKAWAQLITPILAAVAIVLAAVL